jgi:hypothetical protein
MRRKTYLSLVILTLLYLAAWTGFAKGRKGNSQRPTWEYMVSYNGAHPDKPVHIWINQLGIEGWELVTIDQGNFYFKRPMQQNADIPK